MKKLYSYLMTTATISAPLVDTNPQLAVALSEAHIKTLSAWLNRWARWENAYATAKVTGARFEKMPPSKNSKYRAYESGHWLNRNFGLGMDASTRIGLAQILAAAQAARFRAAR